MPWCFPSRIAELPRIDASTVVSYALSACRRRALQSRSSACSTTRLYASGVSTARSSAIAPRSSSSTTSRSTTALARSRPQAPHTTSGASRARHDHLVFVHQDVVLHSLAALERAAAVLDADDGIGLAGAFGVERGGRLVGRVRDRVVLMGERADGPVDVDAIDEMLFIVPRRVFDRERLSEAPEFAWHAYAVEYGLRLRRAGLRVCAVDVPLTHNSLSDQHPELSTRRTPRSTRRTPTRCRSARRAGPSPDARSRTRARGDPAARLACSLAPRIRRGARRRAAS